MKNFSTKVSLFLLFSILVSFSALAQGNSIKSVKMLYLAPVINEGRHFEITKAEYSKWLTKLETVPSISESLGKENFQVWTALLTRCQEKKSEVCPLYTVRARAATTIINDTVAIMSRHQLLIEQDKTKATAPEFFMLVNESLQGEKQGFRIEFASWENKEKIIVIDSLALNKRRVENINLGWIEDYAVLVLKPSQVKKINSMESSRFQGQDAGFYVKDFNGKDNHNFPMVLPNMMRAIDSTEMLFYSDYVTGNAAFICGQDVPAIYCAKGISGGGYFDPDGRMAGIIIEGTRIDIEGTPTTVMFAIELDIDKLINEIKNRVK